MERMGPQERSSYNHQDEVRPPSLVFLSTFLSQSEVQPRQPGGLQFLQQELRGPGGGGSQGERGMSDWPAGGGETHGEGGSTFFLF